MCSGCTTGFFSVLISIVTPLTGSKSEVTTGETMDSLVQLPMSAVGRWSKDCKNPTGLMTKMGCLHGLWRNTQCHMLYTAPGEMEEKLGLNRLNSTHNLQAQQTTPQKDHHHNYPTQEREMAWDSTCWWSRCHISEKIQKLLLYYTITPETSTCETRASPKAAQSLCSCLHWPCIHSWSHWTLRAEVHCPHLVSYNPQLEHFYLTITKTSVLGCRWLFRCLITWPMSFKTTNSRSLLSKKGKMTDGSRFTLRDTQIPSVSKQTV